MNVLDKIKNVTNGLNSCGSYSHLCNTCPYNDRRECERELHKDALEVINALRDELKKRTNKAVETMPGFIILTVDTRDYENQKIAVKIDNISYMFDTDTGSNVLLNDNDPKPIKVKEKLEEILEKIAEVKGE